MKNKIIQSTEKFSFFEKMFLFSPIVVWFSYFPNFQIGRESGTNLELSISTKLSAAKRKEGFLVE